MTASTSKGSVGDSTVNMVKTAAAQPPDGEKLTPLDKLMRAMLKCVDNLSDSVASNNTPADSFFGLALAARGKTEPKSRGMYSIDWFTTLGSGGYSSVFAATSIHSDQTLAVKVIRVDRTHSDQVSAEVSALKRVRGHANVITMIDHGPPSAVSVSRLSQHAHASAAAKLSGHSDELLQFTSKITKASLPASYLKIAGLQVESGEVCIGASSGSELD